MRIGVTGASGFIGRRVVDLAAADGCEVVGFSRDPARSIPGCVEVRPIDRAGAVPLEGLDAVVHLAGESLAGLWTRTRRRRIIESRVGTTTRLARSIAGLGARAPGVLVMASAVGYYGDTGEREVDEGAPAGAGFLAGIARRWEEAAGAAAEAGCRVVALRVGLVLGRSGGALGAMLPAFRSGLGARIGRGRQWMSWVHLDDVARMALRAAADPAIAGAWNAVAPAPCRNAEFTRALGAAVGRRAPFVVPALLLRLALGEASRLLLDSVRVRNGRVPGFDHRYGDLTGALAEAAGQRP